jgi:hypothetical protein
MEFKVTNVNQALAEVGYWLSIAGVEENSRNGPVLVALEPVTLTYTHPTERVLFSPLRDANFAFHIFEALWMLAGRNDLAWPLYFNSKFGAFSDDGNTIHGAYGNRWRKHFGYDQLDWIVLGLQCNPDSRREVLTMWDPGAHDGLGEAVECTGDLYVGGHGGRDVPCNTHIYFDLRGGALNMTVLNRSNDLIWGMLGANAVHMTVLQEYMAAWLKAPIGVFRTFSNNVHVYPANLAHPLRELAVDAGIHDLYRQGKVRTFKLVNTNIETWDADLARFMANPHTTQYQDVFFSAVARPMYLAWQQRKEKRGTGLEWARLIGAEDWRRAAVEWIVRRENKLATPTT